MFLWGVGAAAVDAAGELKLFMFIVMLRTVVVGFGDKQACWEWSSNYLLFFGFIYVLA
jgi:hypothetical protein